MMIRQLSTKSIPSCLRLAVAAVLVAATMANVHVSAQEAKAEPVKAELAKAKPAAIGTPNVRALTVTVDLISKTKIEGTLTDTTQLQMKSSFGAVDIPLSEVAGIKFASADDPSTTVVMLNGDSITGATDVQLITVETEWGTARINGNSIGSILFVPGLSWNSQSGLNGTRWNLNETKKEVAATPPAANTGQPTNSLPVQQNGRPVQNFNNGFRQFSN